MIWTQGRVERGVAPQGVVIYAIGDVHGRADLMARLIVAIRRDAARTRADHRVVVFMGDYVDRGPASRDVIEILSRNPLPEFESRYLRGNHDAEMLGFLKDASRGPGWARHGGGETLASYGVETPTAASQDYDWRDARDALEAAMPRSHLRFLESLELNAIYRGYIFVHAGLMPGLPLEEQLEADFLSIRDPFLNDRRKFPWIVVHGHTPEFAPTNDGRRIGVDTGAFHTGVLTAARLEDRAVDFIQIGT